MVKKTYTQFVLLIIITLFLMPVPASSQDVTNSTTSPTTNVTMTASPTNTPVPLTTPTTNLTNATTTGIVPNATPVPLITPTTNLTNATTTVIVPNATPVPNATSEQVPNATMTTIVPGGSPAIQGTTGNISVASSPFGASILIDGIYYGNTPGNITGIPGGNHIIRLTMSGYFDYEGTIYVIPGQATNAFGTLPPLSGYSVASSTTPATIAPILSTAPVIVVQPTQASGGLMENPTVLAAIIGGITASIGAAVTIFTHISKVKKE